jgi:DNA polymerase II small subunit/DNA polymerase delta subunit B
VEAASTTNYWKNGVAIFIVRRFATEAKAIRHYEVDSNVKFTNRSGIDSQNDDSIKFEGFYASQSSVQCGYIVNDFRCVFVARYEEFAVFFSSSIDGSEMTKEDFLESITYIDATFEKLIRGSNK